MLFKKLFKQYILKFSNNTKEMTKRSLVEMSMRGHWSHGSESERPISWTNKTAVSQSVTAYISSS